MQTIIVNSRGQVRPTRATKEQGDVLPLVFDFSLLLPVVDSYTVQGDMPVTGHTRDGSRITVTLNTGQACRIYDLVVRATGNGETRAATVQVKVEDRERGWNSMDCGCGGYW